MIPQQIGHSVHIDSIEYVDIKVEIFNMTYPYGVGDIIAYNGKVCNVQEVSYPIRLRGELVGHQIIGVTIPS
jgi:hypothetical protein